MRGRSRRLYQNFASQSGMRFQVSGTMEQRPDIVMVFRVTDLPHPAPGAQPRFCPSCGEAVWMAPPTLALLQKFAADPPPVHCMQCATALVKQAKEAVKRDDQPGGCPPQAE